jgi:hypothetical protein
MSLHVKVSATRHGVVNLGEKQPVKGSGLVWTCACVCAILQRVVYVKGGSDGETVHCWDLRYTSRGPMPLYKPAVGIRGPNQSRGYVNSLAIDPHHGTLLVGAAYGIYCYDLHTGISRLKRASNYMK